LFSTVLARCGLSEITSHGLNGINVMARHPQVFPDDAQDFSAIGFLLKPLHFSVRPIESSF
jgi:hypothetical protein